jgi:hypothetical protein
VIALLEIGTKVECELDPGKIYEIIDVRVGAQDRKLYTLRSSTGEERRSFESFLTPISSEEKEKEEAYSNLASTLKTVAMPKGMSLTCRPLMNGIMAYWDEVPGAAYYNVKLYINNQVISKRINERTELYHTFTGLAAIDGLTKGEIGKTIPRAVGGGYSNPSSSGLEYYVKVEAENRLGEMIAQSQKTLCKVREF